MTAGATDSSAPAAGRAEQRPFRLPPGATEVVLVRHGASEAAIAGQKFPLCGGRSDPALSAQGEQQAAAVGARLAKENISRLFVTPLRRTHITAAPLVSATGLEYTVLDDLTEVWLGDWEGGEYRIREASGDPLVKRAFEEERWDVIPGGESPESFARRVRAGIEAIVAATGPDAVAAAVVHGGVIGEACRKATSSRPFAFVHSDNGSLTRIVVTADRRWMLRGFNDVSHLQAAS
jgi:2,3-bisphosphoglycerate-dependent phosphoglycerate mutase